MLETYGPYPVPGYPGRKFLGLQPAKAYSNEGNSDLPISIITLQLGNPTATTTTTTRIPTTSTSDQPLIFQSMFVSENRKIKFVGSARHSQELAPFQSIQSHGNSWVSVLSAVTCNTSEQKAPGDRFSRKWTEEPNVEEFLPWYERLYSGRRGPRGWPSFRSCLSEYVSQNSKIAC